VSPAPHNHKYTTGKALTARLNPTLASGELLCALHWGGWESAQ